MIKKRLIGAVMLVLLTVGSDVCGIKNVAMNSASAKAKVEKIAKGDGLLNFGAPFQKSLWILQRRFPEYTRTHSTDVDGYTDLHERGDQFERHYYFKDNKYIGSSAQFYGLWDTNGHNRLEESLMRLEKAFDKKVDDEAATEKKYEWKDSKGNTATVELEMTERKEIIKVKSSTPALQEHSIMEIWGR